MSLTLEFDKSFKKLNKQIEKYIANKTKDIAEELTDDLAEAFVAGARKRLLTRAEPRDGHSKSLVQDIADGIHAENDGELYKTVVIPKGKEGLSMFLEYGTGLIGEEDPHPNAKRIGWKYAINRDRYIPFANNRESLLKHGFVFEKSDTYLDANDASPLYKFSDKKVEAKVYTSYTKSYTDKRGRRISSYQRTITRHEKKYSYLNPTEKWVGSQGIKPVRYIHDTKVNLNRIIGQYRRLPDGAVRLKERLEKYKKNGK